MYQIFESEEAFIAKNNEILATGLCGNATTYADVNQCKHPTLNMWAMPVVHWAAHLFDEEGLVEELTEDWIVTLNKG